MTLVAWDLADYLDHKDLKDLKVLLVMLEFKDLKGQLVLKVNKVFQDPLGLLAIHIPASRHILLLVTQLLLQVANTQHLLLGQLRMEN